VWFFFWRRSLCVMWHNKGESEFVLTTGLWRRIRNVGFLYVYCYLNVWKLIVSVAAGRRQRQHCCLLWTVRDIISIVLCLSLVDITFVFFFNAPWFQSVDKYTFLISFVRFVVHWNDIMLDCKQMKLRWAGDRRCVCCYPVSCCVILHQLLEFLM